MAALSLQVSTVTRTTPTVDDTVATNILNKAVAATGGPVGGTAAQRMDHILGVLRAYLVDLANGQDLREREAQAQTDARNNRFTW